MSKFRPNFKYWSRNPGMMPEPDWLRFCLSSSAEQFVSEVKVSEASLWTEARLWGPVNSLRPVVVCVVLLLDAKRWAAESWSAVGVSWADKLTCGRRLIKDGYHFSVVWAIHQSPADGACGQNQSHFFCRTEDYHGTKCSGLACAYEWG